MERPTDIFGSPIVMGRWYWAKSRTGQIAGTGKFLVPISDEEITFFLNGTAYSPDAFRFVLAEDPSPLFGS